ncbi:hypothetical protein [Pannonibacter phragmitetus]|nr:hypothetical protein [Pannonibacter phragmitetus]
MKENKINCESSAGEAEQGIAAFKIKIAKRLDIFRSIWREKWRARKDSNL